jgi:Mce-associated membrane protein
MIIRFSRRRAPAEAELSGGEDDEFETDGTGDGTAAGRRRIPWLPLTLGVTALLLGGLAVWFSDETDRLRSGPGSHNSALTDAARTAEVKGKVADAVNAIFSYDYTNTARTEHAAQTLLTGKAVGQYDGMLAQVRAQAPRDKLVLTTTVTDSAVEMLDGGRARVLLFADQRNTKTSGKDTTYAAAMLAVDVVRQGGVWKIIDIDTLGVPG